jgi:hypothetical protein
MKLGTNTISTVKLGTNQVQKVYLGTNEVWSSFTGLLDTYSGAAAAYSLRKLRSAYTGNAIRVRRASDNTEQNIGFVNNELDTSSLTSFCSGTNGFVTTWYDQSGNANNATQTTAAKQPQIVSSGSVINQNSNPTIKFDANNTILTFSSVTPKTFWAVHKIDTVNPANYLMWDTTAIQGFFINGSDPSVNNKYGLFDATSAKLSTINGNTNRNLSYWHFSNLYNLGINGASSVEIASSTVQISISQMARTLAGTNLGLNGNIQEIIIYSSNQATNRLGIETNINDFYSIY